MPLAPWESAAVLTQSLSSLRDQTLQPDCLVVSADGVLPEALRAVLIDAALPLKLLEGPGGEGVGPVLARGLLACTQDLVVRADADDLSLPERCAEQVERMHADPHLKALSGPIAEFDLDPQRWLRLRTVPLAAEAIWTGRAWRNPINHPAVILRRSAVLSVGSYRNKPGFEDYDLWLRLLDRFGPHSVANLERVLVLARIGGGHLSRRRGWRYARSEFAFYLACWREGLMPSLSAPVALTLRLPWRLLPAPLLAWLMGRLRRRSSP